MTRRIAILNTNTDESDFARRHPDDGRKVEACLLAQRPQWHCEVHAVHRDEFPQDPTAYDGWVMTGSVSSVNEGLPWMLRLAALVRGLHARRVPLVGLCFGHQMVAHALGGRVGPSPKGWRVGVAPTHFHVTPAWMNPVVPDIRLFAAHEEQVLQPPPLAQVIGGDDFAPVGAMTVGEHILSTQYHPELSRGFMQELLQVYASEWTPALVAQAGQQVLQPVDGALFFRWMAQFLETQSEPSP
ncbi:MAG: type 1 glutamine amidotransferase [Rubrivivax sp.]